jgi:hypothetical protein
VVLVEEVRYSKHNLNDDELLRDKQKYMALLHQHHRRRQCHQ